jgi:hypothetical protein
MEKYNTSDTMIGKINRAGATLLRNRQDFKLLF